MDKYPYIVIHKVFFYLWSNRIKDINKDFFDKINITHITLPRLFIPTIYNNNTFVNRENLFNLNYKSEFFFLVPINYRVNNFNNNIKNFHSGQITTYKLPKNYWFSNGSLCQTGYRDKSSCFVYAVADDLGSMYQQFTSTPSGLFLKS
jgi:hypothetical protein